MRVGRRATAAAALLVMGASTLFVGMAPASATAAVRSKLLSLSNLPPGWTLSNLPATKGVGGPCAVALDPKPTPGITATHVVFTDRGRLPVLAEELAIGEGVRARYRYANAVLKSCKSLTFSLAGRPEKAKLRPLAFPEVGSSSSAYRITVPTTLGVSVGIDFIVVRSGSYGLIVEYSVMGVPDSSVFRSFVKEALAKVTGVGSTAPSPDELPPKITPTFQ